MCSLAVVEARDGMALKPGFVFVAPGAANIEIEREGAGPGVVRVRAPDKGASAKITPSGDMLLASGARLFEQRFCAVVLTGMGADGSEGATLAREHGATVLAEDPIMIAEFRDVLDYKPTFSALVVGAPRRARRRAAALAGSRRWTAARGA